MVRRIRIHKTGGNTKLRAEIFKKWLQEAYMDEGNYTTPSTERWQSMVEITQFIW